MRIPAYRHGQRHRRLRYGSGLHPGLGGGGGMVVIGEDWAVSGALTGRGRAYDGREGGQALLSLSAPFGKTATDLGGCSAGCPLHAAYRPLAEWRWGWGHACEGALVCSPRGRSHRRAGTHRRHGHGEH